MGRNQGAFVDQSAEAKPQGGPIVLGCTLSAVGRQGATRGLRPLSLACEAEAGGAVVLVAYDLDGARLAPLPGPAAERLAGLIARGHPAEARVSGFTEDGGIDIEVVIGPL
jgi:hypothetical protein